jgi:hypothetical protein
VGSDFDQRVLDPVCMMRPKHAKCFTMKGVSDFRFSSELKLSLI